MIIDSTGMVEHLHKFHTILMNNISSAVLASRKKTLHALQDGTFWKGKNPEATYVWPASRKGNPYDLEETGSLKSAMSKAMRLRRGSNRGGHSGFYLSADNMDIELLNTAGKEYAYWRVFEYGASYSNGGKWFFAQLEFNPPGGKMISANGKEGHYHKTIPAIGMFSKTAIGVNSRKTYNVTLVNRAVTAATRLKAVTFKE